jgi:hypothetical protein
MMSGLWHVPVAGFEWRDDVRPAAKRGRLVAEDPDPEWWLVPLGAEVRRYPVLNQPKLTRDFHRVSIDASRPSILEFARRYGSLSSGTWLIRRGQLAGPGPTAVTMGGDPRSFGESWGHWQKEAIRFRHLYELWQQLVVLQERHHRSGYAIDQARRELERRIVWAAPDAIQFRSEVSVGDQRLPSWSWITAPQLSDHEAIISNIPAGDSVAAARFFILREINKRLAGHVDPHLLPFRAGVLRFVPDSLLSAIYLRFAFEVSEGIGRLRECEGCAQPFVPGRSDQRFCTKNCRERASYRRRTGGAKSERGLTPHAIRPRPGRLSRLLWPPPLNDGRRNTTDQDRRADQHR